MRAPELVVIGGPNSGKTHYAGQLYGRLQRNPGALRIRRDAGTPSDLSALKEVLSCLEDGHAANHTATGTSAEVHLPLVDAEEHAMDVRWPDYGGEQIRSVFSDRSVPDAWVSRLARADGWVLLIRLTGETTYPSALGELIARSKADAKPTTADSSSQQRAGTWDANAWWVELLQILLHVAGLGTVVQLQKPRLIVLLSCYDELDAGDKRPGELLRQKLPLVYSFIHSTWSEKALSIWGLSALGKPLDQKSQDEAFIDDGPETQGWVIAPTGGARDPDLSKPLAWLLKSP